MDDDTYTGDENLDMMRGGARGSVYAPQMDLYLPGLILPMALTWLLIYSAVRLAIRHERKARKG